MFGLEDDPTDSGAMNDLSSQIQSIDKNLKDLNHHRIDDIEERLDTLQTSIERLDTRLSDEEDDGEDDGDK